MNSTVPQVPPIPTVPIVDPSSWLATREWWRWFSSVVAFARSLSTGQALVFGPGGDQKASPKIVMGTGVLVAGALTVTFAGDAVFASAGSFVSLANDTGGAAAAASVVNVSGSQITIFGSGTHPVSFLCVGT